ncbi:DNA mismatch endonuclease Vsr [Pseudomonas sp.]|uniref:very short patch repair endonuclease n=1 Tax=Pseudomonas sp. TaxID=306 RepID=UPI0031E3F113
MDIVDSATRSLMMSGIRGRDTKPEITVRKFLHARGYRFRLHRKDLPGRPDIVLPRFRTCIFIHGCFWHHHKGCRFATLPKTRADFWAQKLKDNVERDRRAQEALLRKGWRVMTIWECELKHPEAALAALLGQLENSE